MVLRFLHNSVNQQHEQLEEVRDAHVKTPMKTRQPAKKRKTPNCDKLFALGIL